MRFELCTPKGSISPTFYEQLLRAQIPKAQKDSQVKQLFVLSGSSCINAAGKHVDEFDPWPRHLNFPKFQFLSKSFSDCWYRGERWLWVWQFNNRWFHSKGKNLRKFESKEQWKQVSLFSLNHWFLTGGPWTTKGSVERVSGGPRMSQRLSIMACFGFASCSFGYQRSPQRPL